MSGHTKDNLGRALRRQRRFMDLDQQEVADALRVAVKTVQRIEAGKSAKDSTVAAYAALVGVSLDATLPAAQGEAA